MDEDGRDDTSPVNSRRDDTKDIERRVDPSAYALGSVFGPVALPLDLPDDVKNAILDRAAQMRDAAGDMVIHNRMSAEAGQSPRKRDDDDGDDVVSQYIQVAQREQQQERERESERQWLATSHSYAGHTMTGEEWHRMIDWFRDDRNVAEWEDAMMAETGASREEVRRTGGKMKRFYELTEKDARGTLTEEERRDLNTLQNDRDVRRGIEVQQEIQGFRSKLGQDRTAESAAAADDSQRDRTVARSDLNEDVTAPAGPLAQVAPLAPVYADAAAGNTRPQPSSPTVVPSPAPAVAANTVRISPDNMFG